MLENVMHKLGGVNAFGIVTICLFFAFFIGMIVYAIRLKKSYLQTMCELPLEDESASNCQSSSKRTKSYE